MKALKIFVLLLLGVILLAGCQDKPEEREFILMVNGEKIENTEQVSTVKSILDKTEWKRNVVVDMTRKEDYTFYFIDKNDTNIQKPNVEENKRVNDELNGRKKGHKESKMTNPREYKVWFNEKSNKAEIVNERRKMYGQVSEEDTKTLKSIFQ